MICQKLRYCFLHEVNNVTPEQIEMKPGCKLRTEVGKIDYTVSTKNADAGSTTTETVKLTSNLQKSILHTVIMGKVILELTDSNGNIYIVGSISNPVTFTIRKNPPEAEITFSVTK